MRRGLAGDFTLGTIFLRRVLSEAGGHRLWVWVAAGLAFLMAALWARPSH